MNESTCVTASSLAITEKRPRKTGGCVGIFFQLFDWNRRFAKKKLFSKKLLTSDRGKEGSKKFGSGEKLPKLRLIADENSGGFPNVNKNGVSNVDSSSEGKNGAQTPSLVARLMGLESMPSNKLKKNSSGEIRGEISEKVVGDDDEFENGITRQEFRAHKLQKTGMVERRSVTRFGAEALQLKNVLSRSRKPHHKLASPVKSQSQQSRRNGSRLIGAATRILEPGLQARSKAKCAITYTHNARQLFGNEFSSEPMKSENLDLSRSSEHYTDTLMLNGQSSCKNCGTLLDVVECAPKRDGHTSVFVSANPSQVSKKSNSRYACSPIDQDFSNRMPLERGGHVHWHSTNQLSESRDFDCPVYFKDKTRRQADVMLYRDRYPSRSKLNCLPMNRATSATKATNAVSDTKDYVALNRSLSGGIRVRVPAKVDDIKFDKRTKFETGRDHCFSPGQKRQTTNIRKQGESSGLVGSSNNKPRVVGGAVSTGKHMRRVACSVDRTCIERQADNLGQSNRIVSSGNKNSDGMTFRFSSPMKLRSEIPTKVERRSQNGSPCKVIPRKETNTDKRDEKICLQKLFPLTGDTLGALLEEKLKEMTRQVEYENGMNGSPLTRTTANIFQELICALEMERRLSQNDKEFSPRRNTPYHQGHRSTHSTNFSFQAKQEKAGALVGYRHNSDHLSPGSVLEASFSNDSCCSSSLEDRSGHMLHSDSLSYSYDESQVLDSETDLSYSGISSSKKKADNESVVDLLNYISEVLCSIDFLNTRLKGNKRSHAKEVIFNAELVLGNPVPRDFISHFLLNELDTLAGVMWINFCNILGFQNLKEESQLKGFVFDCLIEYLDSKYSRYSKCGFRTWTNLHPHVNSGILIQEMVEEVKRWMGFVGLITDELTEMDMSHCVGKWTDFDIEAFENGAEIEAEILQTLVDEVVIDLTAGICC